MRADIPELRTPHRARGGQPADDDLQARTCSSRSSGRWPRSATRSNTREWCGTTQRQSNSSWPRGSSNRRTESLWPFPRRLHLGAWRTCGSSRPLKGRQPLLLALPGWSGHLLLGSSKGSGAGTRDGGTAGRPFRGGRRVAVRGRRRHYASSPSSTCRIPVGLIIQPIGPEHLIARIFDTGWRRGMGGIRPDRGRREHPSRPRRRARRRAMPSRRSSTGWRGRTSSSPTCWRSTSSTHPAQVAR